MLSLQVQTRPFAETNEKCLKLNQWGEGTELILETMIPFKESYIYYFILNSFFLGGWKGCIQSGETKRWSSSCHLFGISSFAEQTIKN